MVRVSEPLYFVEGLWRIREGATFDELREHLVHVQQAVLNDATRRRRSGNRQGRSTATSTHSAMWTTARDVLVELKTLGLVPRGLAVPSSRVEMEEARSRRYVLSAEGIALLPLAERRAEGFEIFDHFLMLEIEAHKELASLWVFLRDRGRLLIPACDAKLIRGDVTRWKSDIHTALEDIAKADPSYAGMAGEIFARLERNLTRAVRPSAKDAAQWLDEAVGNAALRALGLDSSYVSVEVMAVLLTRYFVAGRTFHHPDFNGQLIYPIAQIDIEAKARITRRQYAEVRDDIRREVINCLSRLGPGQHTVWRVRAEVAYRLRVSDSAVDRALAELRYERHSGTLRLAFLGDFVGALPPSASPLIIGRDAYYQIAVLLPRPEDESNVSNAA